MPTQAMIGYTLEEAEFTLKLDATLVPSCREVRHGLHNTAGAIDRARVVMQLEYAYVPSPEGRRL